MTDKDPSNNPGRASELLKKIRRLSPAVAALALTACGFSTESVDGHRAPEFGPGHRVELVAKPLVIDELATTKDVALQATYDIGIYPDENTDEAIVDARQTVESDVDMSVVRQQALDAIDASAANITADPTFTHTSAEDLAENAEESRMLADIIDTIQDPELQNLAKQNLDLAKVDAAIDAAKADEKAIADGLVAGVEDAEIKQSALDALAGNDQVSDELSGEFASTKATLRELDTTASDALYDGSGIQASTTNYSIEAYEAATKDTPEELTWLKDQADEIIRFGMASGKLEDIAQTKEKLLAAPESIKALALIALDGEIAKSLENGSIEGYNLEDITADVGEKRQIVASITDPKLRGSMERYLNLLIADKTEYMPDPEVAAATMALITDEKIKARAQAANGGDISAQEKLVGAETKIEAAITDAWLNGYRTLLDGSNSQATDINEDAAKYTQQR